MTDVFTTVSIGADDVSDVNCRLHKWMKCIVAAIVLEVNLLKVSNYSLVKIYVTIEAVMHA